MEGYLRLRSRPAHVTINPVDRRRCTLCCIDGTSFLLDFPPPPTCTVNSPRKLKNVGVKSLVNPEGRLATGTRDGSRSTQDVDTDGMELNNEGGGTENVESSTEIGGSGTESRRDGTENLRGNGGGGIQNGGVAERGQGDSEKACGIADEEGMGARGGGRVEATAGNGMDVDTGGAGTNVAKEEGGNRPTGGSDAAVEGRHAGKEPSGAGEGDDKRLDGRGGGKETNRARDGQQHESTGVRERDRNEDAMVVEGDDGIRAATVEDGGDGQGGCDRGTHSNAGVVAVESRAEKSGVVAESGSVVAESGSVNTGGVGGGGSSEGAGRSGGSRSGDEQDGILRIRAALAGNQSRRVKNKGNVVARKLWDPVLQDTLFAVGGINASGGGTGPTTGAESHSGTDTGTGSGIGASTSEGTNQKSCEGDKEETEELAGVAIGSGTGPERVSETVPENESDAGDAGSLSPGPSEKERGGRDGGSNRPRIPIQAGNAAWAADGKTLFLLNHEGEETR